MIHITFDIIVLIISILVGLFIIGPKSKLYLRVFPYYLILTLLAELIGHYYQKRGINNVIIYNIYAPIQFFFLAYFFGQG